MLDHFHYELRKFKGLRIDVKLIEDQMWNTESGYCGVFQLYFY